MAVLLGRQSAGTNGDFSAAGHTACWRFVASATGDLKYIFGQTKEANATATGVRLGIYTDDGGADPAVLLGVAAVDVLADARGTGVFRATLASTVAIASGTPYWLGWFAATEAFNFQGDTSGTYYEIIADFPDPFGLGIGPSTTNAIIWGEDAGDPTPTTDPMTKRILFTGLRGP